MARGIGMSGRRRSQRLDAIIAELEGDGFLLPAQKIGDIRDSEWDLGHDHASMSAESVGHLAGFIRRFRIEGRLPIVVVPSGEVALEWDDRQGCRLVLTFMDDGSVRFEATMPGEGAAASGTGSPDDALAAARQTGAWDWAMGSAGTGSP